MRQLIGSFCSQEAEIHAGAQLPVSFLVKDSTGSAHTHHGGRSDLT